MATKKKQPGPDGALSVAKWINTPFSYTRVMAGQSKLEQDVLLQVSEQIQSSLKPFFDQEFDKLADSPNPLFRGRERERLLEPIRIFLADYGIGPSHYNDIRKAVDSILDIKWVIPVITDGGVVHTTMNVFSRGSTEYSTPSGEAPSNRGYADFYINPDMADFVFDMSQGYVQHPRKIVRESSATHTSLLYLLIKHHCGRRKKCVIPFLDIKKHLGLVVRDPVTDRIVSYTIAEYSKFKKRVLDKAQKDLESMAERGLIDYTFSYQEVRANGKVKGDPAAIEFTLLPTKVGALMIEDKRKKGARLKLVDTLLARCGDLSQPDVADIVAAVPAPDFKAFSDYAYKDLPRIIERVQPEDVAAFIKRLLERWIRERQAAKEPPTPSLFSVPEDPAPDDIVPGAFAGEYERLLARCSPQYRAWLEKARFVGAQRGGIYVSFPSRKDYDGFCAFEADCGNARIVEEFRALYAEIMGRDMLPFVRGFDKLSY